MPIHHTPRTIRALTHTCTHKYSLFHERFTGYYHTQITPLHRCIKPCVPSPKSFKCPSCSSSTIFFLKPVSGTFCPIIFGSLIPPLFLFFPHITSAHVISSFVVTGHFQCQSNIHDQQPRNSLKTFSFLSCHLAFFGRNAVKHPEVFSKHLAVFEDLINIKI